MIAEIKCMLSQLNLITSGPAIGNSELWIVGIFDYGYAFTCYRYCYCCRSIATIDVSRLSGVAGYSAIAPIVR